jgi:hypothetical protein
MRTGGHVNYLLEQFKFMCTRSEAAATHSQKIGFSASTLGAFAHGKVTSNDKETRGSKMASAPAGVLRLFIPVDSAVD